MIPTLPPLPENESPEDGLPEDGLNRSRDGPATAQLSLHRSFASRIQVDQYLSRRLVSYQGNRNAPGLRWLKYREGFSSGLVRELLGRVKAERVLDPFSGIGTSALTACGMGLQGTGIEIMPVGNLAARAITAASNGLEADDIRAASDRLLGAISRERYNEAFLFPHVPITMHAFPEATERDLAIAREFTNGVTGPALRAVLTLACVSVLEEVSYTRKAGQFLRWDPRSGRNGSQQFHRKPVPTLREALRRRLAEMAADIPALQRRYGGPQPSFIDGSSLTELGKLPPRSFDTVITSPPYANRYDYTRTYALELAYLGHGPEEFKELRQALLSATVENRSKRELLAREYGKGEIFSQAVNMADNQDALQEILGILQANAGSLSNAKVISMVQNYFAEMALVIGELGRLMEPGGNVFMVNDNVRYHGQEIPVDLVLSDFAEQSGFRCETIWTLNRGKGNSSQQMDRFGRQELRKCVYHWRRLGG